MLLSNYNYKYQIISLLGKEGLCKRFWLRYHTKSTLGDSVITGQSVWFGLETLKGCFGNLAEVRFWDVPPVGECYRWLQGSEVTRCSWLRYPDEIFFPRDHRPR
jgi:hypothetical protein